MVSGFAIGVPDHNNNNESDNRYIKEDQGRKRLGLMQFLVHAETNLVKDWSLRRRSESYTYVQWQDSPLMKLKHWTQAWEWSSKEKSIIKYKRGDVHIYCMPGGLETKLSNRD